MPTILDLCGGTGSWSRPYREAGYRVVIVDPLAEGGDNWPGTVENFYVALLSGSLDYIADDVRGILMAPPCTEFSGSGARWWANKDDNEPHKLTEAISTVLACLRVRVDVQPKWWVMENPVGRMRRIVRERAGMEIGPYAMTFNPCDYGDPWTKRTCLWGDFTPPKRTPVEPTEGSKIHLMAPGPDRWRLRSATPPGFARAFFEANP